MDESKCTYELTMDEYKALNKASSDTFLTKDKWDQWMKSMMAPVNPRPGPNYQQAQQTYYNNKTTQPNQNSNAIPFPGKWQGDPKIISPYVDWDKKVWVVTKVDGEGNGYVRALFSSEEEADKYSAEVNCDQYEYMDVSYLTLDAEVPVDESKREN